MASQVAVIGAGPCGLAQLRAFEEARRQGAEVPEIVCFEQQSDWGGLWNYTWRTGLDEHGDPVEEATPSRPVLVLGLTAVPGAGDKFLVVDDDRRARQIAEKREARARAAAR